jgi:hypothetical protein
MNNWRLGMAALLVGLGLLLALAWWGWSRGGLALLQIGMVC